MRPHDNGVELLLRVPLSGLLAAGLPKEGVGYLALDRIEPYLQRAALELAAAVDIVADDAVLRTPQLVVVKISLPFDSSFQSYEAARAHLDSPPLPAGTQVFWTQGFLDARFDYASTLGLSNLAIRVRLDRLAPRVTTRLGAFDDKGTFRAFRFVGDVGRIRIDPRWTNVLPPFIESGVRDAFGRLDLWLLSACMILASRRTASRSIVFCVAGIVVASLAVIYGPDSSGIWLPAVFDCALAALIVMLLVQNIARRRPGTRSVSMLIAGVVGGISWAATMRPTLQFAGRHVFEAVLAFDVGIALAQFGIVISVLAVTSLLRGVLPAGKLGMVVLSALVCNIAWNTLMERVRTLVWQPWPLWTPAAAVTATSWLLLIALSFTVVWLSIEMSRFLKTVGARIGNGRSVFHDI